MIRKVYFEVLLSALAVCFSSLSVFGQETSITGTVMLKKDTTTAVEGATVTCYHLTDFTEGTDLKCGSAKTDKDGNFTLAVSKTDVQYILSVNGAGIGPRITLPLSPGEKGETITVTDGDGKALTKVEVWNAFAFSEGSGGLTKEQKLAKAEYEKKLAEQTVNNEKIANKTKVIQAALEAGNKAYNSGEFDIAVAKYEEGVQADPDFVGSAPVLLNNKGLALKRRAVVNYTTAVKTKDNATIDIAKDVVLKDLTEALVSFDKSHTVLTTAKTADISDQANYKRNLFNAIDGARDVINVMNQIKIADPEKADSARRMTAAYLKLESDKEKQRKAQTNLAKFLMFAYDYDGAVTEFKKALEYSTQDPDILAELGITLYASEKKQQSLNYLDVYLKVAPKNHEMREGVAEIVKELTTVDKLKPQKL